VYKLRLLSLESNEDESVIYSEEEKVSKSTILESKPASVEANEDENEVKPVVLLIVI